MSADYTLVLKIKEVLTDRREVVLAMRRVGVDVFLVGTQCVASLQFQLFQFQLFFCGGIRGGYRGRIMLRPYMGVLLLEY